MLKKVDLNSRPLRSEFKEMTVFYYLIGLVSNVLECKTKNKELNVIKKKLRVVDSFQDYSFILKKLNELEVLKKVILSDEQLICFEYLNKPFHNLDNNLEKTFPNIYGKDDKTNLIQYFIDMKMNKLMSDVDEKLFNAIKFELREEIDKKLLS
jgi:hypothetical protein